MDHDPIVARFPRTLHEAFPHDKSTAEFLEYHPDPRRERLVPAILLCAFIGVGLAAALVSWWSS